MTDSKIDSSCAIEKDVLNNEIIKVIMEVAYLKVNPEAKKKYDDVVSMLEDILAEIDNRPAYLNLVYLDIKMSMTFKNWYAINKNAELSNSINQFLHDNHLLDRHRKGKLVVKMNEKTFTNMSKSMKVLSYCHVLCRMEVIVDDNIQDNDVVIETKIDFN